MKVSPSLSGKAETLAERLGLLYDHLLGFRLAVNVLLATTNRRLRSAMTRTLQHAQIGAPRTDGVTILVGHHARELMQMGEVVNCPGRQKLR